MLENVKIAMNFFLLFFLSSVLIPCAVLAQTTATLDMNGLTGVLAKNRGKVIAINFFATWCPPCRIEIQELVRAADEYAGRDIVFIGLSVGETPKVVAPFVKNMGIRYHVYMASRDITDAYRVSSIPHNAFYSRNGLLIISEPGVIDGNTLKLVINKFLEH